ncbi:hypothetical protein CONLIGDRAFT_196246 [Coniochaeta ligniaria NRRL 30616]|uniref:Uncharacterized protein n=1 Tax=Coniochaeta ligniaria NRRL 30616 TaxID=1408157 RepID=A0A1J7JUX1_9PEZI|nr:hypothetical protein CONLIGDRAFT_196246 [Coniochaeta ligniaria NRRL 30616]
MRRTQALSALSTAAARRDSQVRTLTSRAKQESLQRNSHLEVLMSTRRQQTTTKIQQERHSSPSAYTLSQPRDNTDVRTETLSTLSAETAATTRVLHESWTSQPRATRRSQNWQKQNTYNTRDSPVVTHPSTSLAIACLSMGERTGSRVLRRLWSYVESWRVETGQMMRGIGVAVVVRSLSFMWRGVP